MPRTLPLVALVVAAVLSLPGAAPADPKVWALLEGGGQVVLIRHAVTTRGSAIRPGCDSTTAPPSGT
jgi:hypothetical protein